VKHKGRSEEGGTRGRLSIQIDDYILGDFPNLFALQLFYE